MKKIEHAAIHKILYINLAFIGDVILSTPATRALRETYPDRRIDMLVTPWAAAVARGNPYINKVHMYDKQGIHRKIGRLFQLVKELRRERYDLVICSNFAARGAMLAKALGAQYRIGYDAQHAGIFLTHTVSAKRTVVKHETQNRLDLLAPFGITTKDLSLDYRLEPADIESLRNKVALEENQAAIAICPFGRHPLNSWSTQGYVELITYLSARDQCYLIGGVNEKARLEELNAQCNNQAKVLAGDLSIGELAAFLKECRLMITVDTGPMHLAGAVGTPILALFGRSDSRIWGPRGEKDQVLQAQLECVPCIIPRECAHHSCMELLSADLVISAVEKMLDRTPIHNVVS